MARRPKPGRCVYCLNESDQLTWDHVFPQAWYPDTTPPNLEKWKIPACPSCNALFGKCESELLIRLGLCIDPENPNSAGVVNKVLRALNPGAAKDRKDARARKSLRDDILGHLLNASEMPLDSLFPGFGPHPGIDRSEQEAILVDAGCLHAFMEKIVRGIFYVADGVYVEPPYEIEISFVKENGAEIARDALARFGETYAREPGITVRRAMAAEDPRMGIFEIEVWKKLRGYGIVRKRAQDSAT